ncbi:MAG: biotin--[acetyl-CoA-carboxylase] ligase [Bacillota bacterium]
MERLDTTAIASRQGKALGTRVIYRRVLTSTMDLARHLAEQGEPEGTVVVADEQTQGRGRRGRSWWCPAEAGLLFSVILRPELEPSGFPWLTVAMALALAAAGQVLGVNSKTKWPNDVVCPNGKLAGVIGEASGSPAWVVLGAGINVNRPGLLHKGFPETIAFLSDHLGRPVDRATLLGLTLDGLEERCLALRGGPGTLMQEWILKSASYGQRVQVGTGDAAWEGIDEGLDRHGALLLRTEHGSLLRFPWGEVSLIRILP